MVLASIMATSGKPTMMQNLGNSRVLKEGQTGPVIGDLGGVAVCILCHDTRLVEYDGDPSFMAERNWLSPRRTYQVRCHIQQHALVMGHRFEASRS
jgi:hypothetical protein